MQSTPTPNSASPANIQNVVAQNSSLTANALKISVDSDRTKPAQSISAASCQRKRPRFRPGPIETDSTPTMISAPPASWCRRQRLSQHEIGEDVAEQRRALEERRHHRRLVALQRLEVERDPGHVENAGQRHQHDAHGVAVEHARLEPGDDRHQHHAHQRGENQQHDHVGVLEVTLDQILVQMNGDRPEDRAAECEDEPAHGRVIASR